VDPRAQYPYIVTSRGLSRRVHVLLLARVLGEPRRFRSRANILDELELLKRRFGLLYVRSATMSSRCIARACSTCAAG
jgi:hypothetical protein